MKPKWSIKIILSVALIGLISLILNKDIVYDKSHKELSRRNNKIIIEAPTKENKHQSYVTDDEGGIRTEDPSSHGGPSSEVERLPVPSLDIPIRIIPLH